MLDGLLSNTCVIDVDRIQYGAGDYRMREFDLVEYGCRDGRRYLLRRRHFDDSGPGFAVVTEDIERVLRQVNFQLRQKPHCDCA